MNLTPDQLRAVQAPGSVAVTAGAGTGKTHMLTARYVHHLTEHGLRPLNIVAATFTERAASELRNRIRRSLRESGRPERLTSELEAAQIGTLHSLAGRICREHPAAAGVPYDFRLQDELEQRLWLHGKLSDALARLPAELTGQVPYRTLRDALTALLGDPHTGRQALALGPEEWPELLEREKQRVYDRLRSTPAWRESVAVLEAVAGNPGDKQEVQRRAALSALAQLEAGDFSPEAWGVLDSLTGRGGSGKAWAGESLQAVRRACSTVRDLFRGHREILELTLSELDEALAEALPGLRRAFELVSGHLADEKRRERILDFNDLELHAVAALGTHEVRHYYRQRWSAFLVDEFQDTNPVQAELLQLLTGIATDPTVRLTIVGDEKQSIYGFRRADVSVFRRFRRLITEAGGENVGLTTSFRSHGSLVDAVNEIVAPALADLHSPLAGYRQQAPGRWPWVRAVVLQDPPRHKLFRSQAEAHLVGELIERTLADATEVFGEDGRARAARPGDIAILTRTWDALQPYGDELAARGIPVIHAGGGNLLTQVPARDGRALLDFLADNDDSLALAVVLRSPFFAVDDRTLVELAAIAGRGPWWRPMFRIARGLGERNGGPGSLAAASRALSRLVEASECLAPVQLLALADELTGYSAVLANLPGGSRRLADWGGFLDVVHELSSAHEDVFAVSRQLRQLTQLPDVKVPRPGMEAGDAVSLMTVHNAKGLEWPIVVLPDLESGSSARGDNMQFEADLGVGLVLNDDAGERVRPALHRMLAARRRDRELDEEKRVTYVALTRARDRLILTSGKDSGGRLGTLLDGLANAGVGLEYVQYEAHMSLPKTPLPPQPAALPATLLGRCGPGLSELPVSALSSYRACPKRFDFQHLQQHPGAGDEARVRTRIGTLTHKALERGLREPAQLEKYDPGLHWDSLVQAVRLADQFRDSETFRDVRPPVAERESQVALEIDGIRLVGVADLVADDFVLDYKTGRMPTGDEHRLQVAVYAHALARERAHLAYLAANELVSLSGRELDESMTTVRELLARMTAGDLEATPSPEVCRSCAYRRICDDSLAPSGPRPTQGGTVERPLV